MSTMSLSITRPDDFHLHLRDGADLRSVAHLSASVFRRAIIMPNLKPPVVTTKQVGLSHPILVFTLSLQRQSANCHACQMKT